MTHSSPDIADLADQIEKSDGLIIINPGYPGSTSQLGIRKTVTVIAALRALAQAAAQPVRPHSIYTKFHLDNWTDEDFAKHAAATRKTLAYLLALEAAAPPQTAREWPDVAEDDSDVIRAAHAIAEHGIGRPWNDFLPTNAYDVDHGDLIEYGRAAVAALRAASQSQAESAPPQAAVMREALEECLTVLELFQHMSSASASWRKYLERKGMPLGSEFVAGPCHATVLLALQKVRAALSLPAP